MITVTKTPSLFLYSFISGLLFACAFAPIDWSGMVFVSAAILYYFLEQCHTVKQAGFLGLWYGIGKYGLGVSWIFVSIYNFSDVHWIVSLIITVLFIVFLSLYEILFCLMYWKIKKALPNYLRCLVYATLATCIELLRSNLFSGFPWLLAGHSQTQTLISQSATVIGSTGLSYICYLAGALLANTLIIKQKKISLNYTYGLTLLISLISIGFFSPSDWTQKQAQAISVSLIQANIAHSQKWQSNQFEHTLNTYLSLTQQSLKDDLIVWPETALALPSEYTHELFQGLQQKLKQYHSHLILGAPGSNKDQTLSNSVFFLGDKISRYNKQHLVPFGEYMPFSKLYPIYQWFNVPLANLSQGLAHKNRTFQINQTKLAPFICFEVAFNELFNFEKMQKSQMLLTITDDSWFGHSFAKAQHLQIAQMRSLESGKSQLFASNDGITAFIDNHGHIQHQLPQNKTQVLHAKVYGFDGTTPYSKWRDAPLIIFMFLILFFSIYLNIARAARTNSI